MTMMANWLGTGDDAARERRRGADRRTRTWYALFRGSVRPRRRGSRRAHEQSLTSTDWHEGRWLLIAVLILTLSIADAALTLLLLDHGALEENPVMAWAMHGDPGRFVAVKLALTAGGVVFLAVVARVRAFGRVPVGSVLYAVLAGYAGLVAYELWLLHSLLGSPLFGAR
jgi:hypothetical protein